MIPKYSKAIQQNTLLLTIHAWAPKICSHSIALGQGTMVGKMCSGRWTRQVQSMIAMKTSKQRQPPMLCYAPPLRKTWKNSVLLDLSLLASSDRSNHCDSVIPLHCFIAVLQCLSCIACPAFMHPFVLAGRFLKQPAFQYIPRIQMTFLKFLPKQPSTQTTSKNSVYKQAFPQSFKQAGRFNFPTKASWGSHERNDKRVDVNVQMSGFRGTQQGREGRATNSFFLDLTLLGFVTLNAYDVLIKSLADMKKIGKIHTCYVFHHVSFMFNHVIFKFQVFLVGIVTGSNAFLDIRH